MKKGFSIFLGILILQAIWMSEPKIWAEENLLAEAKSKEEIQKILKLKIEVKTGNGEKFLKSMGLKCEWGRGEAICDVTVNQMDQLKQEGIEFKVIREGIRIERKRLDGEEEKKNKGSVWKENGNNYPIPYQAWTYSPISITSAPSWATVAWIDVHYMVTHPNIGDLAIDLTDEDIGHEYRLWNYEGGSQDNINEYEYFIVSFAGESVNQTWKLWGWDCCVGNDGYIDYWEIEIWYQELPDLIVQSLTATDYNPNVGEYIDVTMVIKNQETGSASSFWNGLFYNLSSPPDINTPEDRFFSISSLDTGDTYFLYLL
jgi:subtilisin-like proprotein convertase family protein